MRRRRGPIASVGLALMIACGPGPPAPSRTAPRADATRSASAASNGPSASLDPELVGSASGADPLYPRLGNGGYDVRAYDIAIVTDPASNETTIRVRLEATANQRLGRFNLDYSGTGVEAVTVDGHPAAFVARDGEIEISPAMTLANGSSFEATVEIAGRPMPVRGAGWTWRPAEQVSAFGLYEALPSWLPVNADPADKATIDLRIVVPRPYVAVGPGELVETTEVGAGREFHWRAGPSSGFALAIRAFETDDLGVVAGIPVRSYRPATVPPRPAAALARIPELLEFVVDRYGPYPFTELNLVWLEGGTSERGPEEGLLYWGPELVEPGQIVHHLTHLWFQANATPRTAHESYLRSAFANYGDLLWLEAAEGVAARDRYMEYWYDQLDGRTEPPADPTDATGNEALFARGPLSLHALRILVGDETFFEILRAWVVRYHRGSPTVDDFVGLAEELSDRPLDDWERGWLRDETVPPATEIGLPAP